MPLAASAHVRLLQDAELQFRMALAVSALAHSPVAEGFSGKLNVFTFGKHVMEEPELTLSKYDECLGAALLEHSATFVLALQMDAALDEVFPRRFEHSDHRIRTTAGIVRAIRNAFAHNPLSPVWLIDRAWKGQTLVLEGILTLDTAKLHKKEVDRMDFGGPTALLRLSEHVRRLISETPSTPSSS